MYMESVSGRGMGYPPPRNQHKKKLSNNSKMSFK